MTTRKASCSCGALAVECAGEPDSVSICHCHECQRRTGSVFGAQGRFQRSQITVKGAPRLYTRAGDSGGTVTFSFCGDCGSTVFWVPSGLPESVMVAVGAFADADFPRPVRTVYEARRHAWAGFPELDVERYD